LTASMAPYHYMAAVLDNAPEAFWCHGNTAAKLCQRVREERKKSR
jgi:hypothetical protein